MQHKATVWSPKRRFLPTCVFQQPWDFLVASLHHLPDPGNNAFFLNSSNRLTCETLRTTTGTEHASYIMLQPLLNDIALMCYVDVTVYICPVQPRPAPWHGAGRHGMPCHATRRDATPRHATPCRAVPCRAVPCRALPCHAVPCRAVPCHAIS